MVVVLKGAIKTHSYVRFDHLRYARRDGGVVLVAVAAARRRRSRCQFYIQLLYKLHVSLGCLDQQEKISLVFFAKVSYHSARWR